MLTYSFTDTSDELHASTGISSRPSWSQQDATALAGDDTLHRGSRHCFLNMSDVSVMPRVLGDDRRHSYE